jgi:hypothetical protein
MPLDFFIDETFHLPANGSGETFYVFAVVGLERSSVKTIRRRLLRMANTTWWHSSKIIQTSGGRTRFKRIGQELGRYLELEIFAMLPISPEDNSGEKARRRLIRYLTMHLASRDRHLSISFEMRKSGGQLKLDRDTIAAIHAEQNLPFIHLKSPAQEPMLWLPDMLASAFRKKLVTDSSDLLESFGKEVLVTFIR